MPSVSVIPHKKKKTVQKPTGKKFYTYADYLKLPGDERYELLNGKLRVMSPSPSLSHQQVSLSLAAKLFNLLKNDVKGCKVISAPFDVILPEKGKPYEQSRTVVQPDLIIVCNTENLKENGYFGVSDIIIEIVSPYSIKIDTTVKYRLYEQYGVKEYWIVFPREKAIQVFLNKEDGFELEETYTSEDKAKIYTLGLEIDLTEVFTD